MQEAKKALGDRLSIYQQPVNKGKRQALYRGFNLVLFLSSTLLSILILSSFPVLFYAKRYRPSESFWAYSYSILYTFGLFWITPYAIATASKSGWLTRELVDKK